jgi:hypothetical protein
MDGTESRRTISAAEHSYLFEAKGIQRYILAGGRLLDIAGASELLAATAKSRGDDLVASVLAAAGWPEKPRFSRRAAGAFMLHYTSSLAPQFERFRALWRLVFSQHAPGLEFAEAFGSGADAAEAKIEAYGSASELRENGSVALLPLAGPFAERSQRTAMPGVERIGDEILDEATVRKRPVGRQKAFANLFIPTDVNRSSYEWPTEMEVDEARDGENESRSEGSVPFPFEGEDRRVAIIHADLSGLGELYGGASDAIEKVAKSSRRPDAIVAMSRDLSQKIEEAVESAAQAATRAVLLPMARIKAVPARPILLGGDDITIIVRADIAIDYARALLEGIERETEASLEDFRRSEPGLDELSIRKLSACAGIAIVRSKQPFHLALELAEALCGYAKKQAKRSGPPYPSALAFHRVTSSTIGDDFEEIVRAEEICRNNDMLIAQPYYVGDATLPVGSLRLDHLAELREALGGRELKTGPLRELKTLLLAERQGGSLSEAAYKNWRKVARGRGESTLEAFDEAMIKLGVRRPEQTIFREGPRNTPLFDALEWSALA